MRPACAFLARAPSRAGGWGAMDAPASHRVAPDAPAPRERAAAASPAEPPPASPPCCAAADAPCSFVDDPPPEDAAAPAASAPPSLAAVAAATRRGVVGAGAAFATPFGPRPLTYADWAASGRALAPVEDFIRRCARAPGAAPSRRAETLPG
jgi:hypothetical protein